MKLVLFEKNYSLFLNILGVLSLITAVKLNYLSFAGDALPSFYEKL
jgi:hypothetical protein